MKTYISFVALIILFGISSLEGFGQDTFLWDGSADNDWSNSANWQYSTDGGATYNNLESVSAGTFNGAYPGRNFTSPVIPGGGMPNFEGANIIFDNTGNTSANMPDQNLVFGSFAIAGGYTQTIAQGNGTLTFRGDFLQFDGTFNQSNRPITFDTDFSQDGGTFTGSSMGANITIGGNLELSSSAQFTSTSGTLFLSDALNVLDNPTFSHNSGTVHFIGTGTSSVLTKIELNLHNVISNKPPSTGLLVITTISPSPSFINIEGNLTISTGLISGNVQMKGSSSSVVVSPSEAQVWTGGVLIFSDNGTPSTQSLNITGSDKACIDAEIQVNGDVVVNFNSDVIADDANIRLTNGAIHTANLITIGDNIDIITQSGNTQDYIQGRIKKIGDDAFTFPVGHSSLSQPYQPISITAPSSNTDEFIAEFISSAPSNPTSFAAQPGIGNQLIKVFGTGYWSLEQGVSTTSTPQVTLSWNGNLAIPAAVTSNLTVAGWNGSAWENHGRFSFLGNETVGSMSNDNTPTPPITAISNYERFAVGLSETGTRYWVGEGTDELWSNIDNWDIVSGGSGGVSLPNTNTEIIFDGADADAKGNCNINVDTEVKRFRIATGYDNTTFASTITLEDGNSLTVGSNGFSQANGNFVIEDMATDVTINGDFTISDVGSFEFSDTGGTIPFTTEGAVDISGGSSIFRATQGTWNAKGNIDITIAAANFDSNEGTLELNGTSNQNFTSSIDPLPIDNLILNNPNNEIELPNLTLAGNFTINDGIWESGNINLEGNLSIGGFAEATNNNAALTFTGGNAQSITNNADAGILNHNIVIDKSSNIVTLNNNLTLDAAGQSLTLTQGILNTKTNAATATLVLEDNVSATGNTNGYIEGPLTKIGDDNFTFPLGTAGTPAEDGYGYHPIRMQFLSSSASFTAEYIVGSPPSPTSIDATEMPPLSSINTESYWTLSGTTDVAVNLSWRDGNFDVGSLSTVTVGGYDGSQWNNLGGTPTTASITTNDITSDGIVNMSTFQAFALAFNDPGTRYWVGKGATNDWSDTGNWSIESGGLGGAPIPTASDNVIFDGVDADARKDCNIDVVAKTNELTVNTAYNGTITQNDAFTTHGDVLIEGGAFSVIGTPTWNAKGNITFSLSGTVQLRNLEFNGSSDQELTTSAALTLTVNNLTINNTGTGSNNDVKIPSLTVNGNFTINDGRWSSGTGDNIDLKGNLIANPAANSTRTGATLTFSGTTNQFISLDDDRIFNHNLVINKSTGDIELNSNLRLTTTPQRLTFSNGNIVTNGNFIAIASGVLVISASDVSHVVGTVRRFEDTGSTSFSFPVGDGTTLKSIHMVTPATVNTSNTVAYHVSYSGSPSSGTPVSPLENVSTQDAWQISREAGTEDVNFTIAWTDPFCNLGLNGDETTAVVAGFNGVNWQSVGGTAGAGSTVSSGEIDFEYNSTYSEFALASTGANQIFFWTNGGGDNLWSNPNNWSVGGCTASVTPNSFDIVVFNGSGNASCNINIPSPTVAGVEIRSGYTQTIALNSNTLTVNGDFTQADGTFNGGTGTLDLNGNWGQTGGDFTAPSSASITGNMVQGGTGTFNANSGTVMLNNSGVQQVTETIAFHNLQLANNAVLVVTGAAIPYTLSIANHFTISNGAIWQVGNLELGGNLTINNDNSQGPGQTLTFVGATSPQEIRVNSTNHDNLEALIVVNKAIFSQEVHLLTNLVLDEANQDLTITQGRFRLENATELVLANNLQVASNGEFTYNSTLGNISTLTFNGSSDQTFTTDGLLNAKTYNLIINKSSGELLLGSSTLNGDLIVENELEFTSGNINLVDGTIFLGSSATLIGENNSNRIYGTGGAIQTSRDLLAGTNNNIAGLGISINSTNPLGSTTITRGHVAQVGENESILRYYDIAPTNSTGLGATLTLAYFDDEINDVNQTESNFVAWSANSPYTDWVEENSTLDASANTVTIAGLDQLNERWTISDKEDRFLSGAPLEIGAGFGNHLDFDGSDDYVNIQDVSKFGVENEGTIEFWMRVPTLTASDRTILGVNGTLGNMRVYINNDRLFYEVAGTTAQSSETVAANTWYHVAIVHNDASTTTEMYINGNPQGIAFDPAFFSALGAIETFSLGALNTATPPAIPTPVQFFRGMLDEVRIWNSNRTAVLRANLYSQVAESNANLLAYWNFDHEDEDRCIVYDVKRFVNPSNAADGDLLPNASAGNAPQFTADSQIPNSATAISDKKRQSVFSSFSFGFNTSAFSISSPDVSYKAFLISGGTEAELPTGGFSFTPSTRTISTSGVAAGEYRFRIEADLNGQVASDVFTVEVGEPNIMLEKTTAPTATIANGGTVDFGSVLLDETNTIEFSVSNAGALPLLFTGDCSGEIDNSVSLSGVNPGEFTLAFDPANPNDFSITFDPNTLGALSATVTIKTNDPDGDFVFTVVGNGTEPIIRVLGNATTISNGDATPDVADDTDFGNVLIGTPITKTFTIENTVLSSATTAGDLTLTDAAKVLIDPISPTIATGDFTLDVSSTSTSIIPEGSTNFEVTFTPLSSGEQIVDIRIPNNDADENPYIFRVRASGGDNPQLDLDATTAGINFSTAVLAGSATQIIKTTAIPSPDITLTDDDDTQLQKIEIQLISKQPAEFIDVSGSLPGGITFTDNGSGSYTLEKTTPLASITEYINALFLLRYNALSSMPAGSRTIQFIAFDDENNQSAVAETTVSVSSSIRAGFGEALSFDGDDFVDASDGAGKFNLSQGTIEAWIKVPNTANTLTIFSASDRTEGNDELRLMVEDRKLAFRARDASSDASNASNDASSKYFSDAIVADGIWHHVAVTRNASETILYVDGAEQTGNPVNQKFFNAITVNHVGLGRNVDSSNPDGEWFFEGEMDEVRVWNDVRTPAELNAFSRSQLVGNESGLVAYWNFDEEGNCKEVLDFVDNPTNRADGTIGSVFNATLPQFNLSSISGGNAFSHNISIPVSGAFTVSPPAGVFQNASPSTSYTIITSLPMGIGFNDATLEFTADGTQTAGTHKIGIEATEGGLSAIDVFTINIGEPMMSVTETAIPTVINSSDTYDFGTVGIGQTETHTFEIENTGDRTLTLYGIACTPSVTESFEYTGSSVFTLDESSISVTELAPTGTASFTVAFAPTGTAAQNGTITFQTNLGEFTFNVTGTGTSSSMTVLNAGTTINDDETALIPNVTDFGEVLNSRTFTFTIENLSTVPLELDPPSPFIRITGPQASEFNVIAPFPNAFIPAGLQTTFTIEYTPAGLGESRALVEIFNNSPDTPYSFVIGGTGSFVDMDVLGNGISIPSGSTTPNTSNKTKFGVVKVDGAGATQTNEFIISNNGTETLDISNIVITGSTDFSPSFTSTSLASGATTNLDITFNPSTVGDINAVVSIQYFDGVSTVLYTFEIEGEGAQARMLVQGGGIDINNSSTDPPTVPNFTDMGDALLSGGTVIKTYQIINNGNSDLLLPEGASGAITITGTNPDNFNVFTPLPINTDPADPIQGTVVSANGGTVFFQIQFLPTGIEELKQAVVEIDNDLLGSDYQFRIQGNAVINASPNMMVFEVEGGVATEIANGAASAVEGPGFIGYAVDGTPTSRTIRINNSGTADLNFTGTPDIIEIAGADVGSFSVSTLVTPLATGDETTFSITFEPGPSDTGPQSALIRIQNDDIQNNNNPFEFFVTGFAGLQPNAVDDAVTVVEEVTSTIDVLANDIDPSGLTLSLNSASIISSPSFGTATVVGNQINYTPQTNFNGTDNFTYEVCNSSSLCTQANVSITVIGDADAPTALDDVYEISVNETRLLAVQSNDVDPDGGGLITNIVTAPENGNAVVQGIDILYSPNADFTGEDRFTYEVCNGALCDEATVSIRVFDGPVARDDEVTVDEDESVVITVLENDEDPLGSELQVGIIRFTAGTIRVNAGHQVIFIPEAEFSGTVNFGYQITNSSGQQDTATVFVTVLPVNDPPVVHTNTYELFEDESISIQPLENAFDPEGESLSFTIQQPTNGVAMISGSNINYRPDADFNGIDSLYLEVCDASEECTQSFVLFNILPVDDTPVAFDDVVDIDARPKEILILANDYNPDPDSLTLTIVTPPTKGNTVILEGRILYLLDVGAIGTDEFIYQICNKNGEEEIEECSQATVTLNILEFNELPIARNINEVTIENIPKTISLFDFATDPEGQRLSFNMLDSIITSTTSEYVLNEGVLTYIPKPSFVGFDTLFYQACDPIGCSQARIVMRVTPSDGSPVAGDDEIIAFAGLTITKDLLENDFDPTDDPLTLTILQNPVNGTLTAIEEGEITYMANMGYVGADSLRYFICNSSNLCDTASVFITVNPSTAPPVAEDDNFIILEDVESVFDVQANDSDPDMDVLITSIVRRPFFGNAFIINGDSIGYIPNANYAGSDVLTYQICDPSGQCAQADVNITIEQVNDPPVAIGDEIEIQEGGQATVNVLSNDTDPEGDMLSIEIITPATHGTATVTANNRINYIIATGYTGLDEVVYRVCDEADLCDEATLSIIVLSETGPPIARNFTVPPFDEDTDSEIFNPSENDRDPENQALTVRFLSSTNLGEIVETDRPNEFIYRPFADAFGVDRIDYQVCDTDNGCDTAFVNFTILPINDAPIAVNDTFNVDQEFRGLLPLVNDIEPDGLIAKNNLTLTLLEYEPGVTTRLGNSNAITVGQSVFYRPERGISGNDTLRYVICDEAFCDTAFIYLNVSIPLNNPIAANDSYTIDVDETITRFDFTDNDRDIDDNLDLLNVRIIEQPRGTVTLSTVQIEEEDSLVNRTAFTYIPELLFSGVDSMRYRIGDLTLLYDTATIYITVREFLPEELIVYDAFSPDGDGINDEWVIEGLQYFTENRVKVIDRWGSVIYEADNYDNRNNIWDGRFQRNVGFGSDVVPEGTYFYIIDLGIGRKPLTGAVEVKRQGQ